MVGIAIEHNKIRVWKDSFWSEKKGETVMERDK